MEFFGYRRKISTPRFCDVRSGFDQKIAQDFTVLRFRVALILRQREHRARRRNAAQDMRSERDQRHLRLGGERA
jgi:hypothetical protein